MILLLSLGACSYEQPLPQAPASSESTIPDAKIVDGIMSFSDESEFAQMLNYLDVLSLDDLKAWEESVGFRTLKSHYLDFVNLSASSADVGYGMSINDMRELYGEVAVIEDDGMFSINCSVPHLAAVLNKKGLVRIGNDLFSYRYGKIVRIEGGDIGKLTMAARLETDLPEQGIYVQTISKVSANRQVCSALNAAGGAYGSSGQVTYVSEISWGFRDACDNNSNDRYRLRETIFNVQSSAIEDLLMKVEVFRRGSFGIWYATNNFSTKVTGTAVLTKATGETVTRTVSFTDNDSDWTVRLLSNYPGQETTPTPPPTFPVPYNQACVTLTFVLTVPVGSYNDCGYAQVFTRSL